MDRRLVAILAADVVGCSRLMGADEADNESAVSRRAHSSKGSPPHLWSLARHP